MGKLYAPSFDGSDNKAEMEISCEPGEVSDGYHTFNELYEHRCLLFCMVAQVFAISNIKNWRTWKSWKHDDGSDYPGWFIAGLDLGAGTVTYHLPASMWELYAGEYLDNAPEWDGHTSSDVINRLRNWLEV